MAKRLRREQFQTTGRLRFPFETISEDTHCAICCELISETTMGPCCHRFCKKCYEETLRKANKECPNCRMEIRNRRVLRADRAFDKLLIELYGDLQAFRFAEDLLSKEESRKKQQQQQQQSQPRVLPPATPTVTTLRMQTNTRLCCELIPHPTARLDNNNNANVLILPRQYVWTLPDISLSSVALFLQREHARRKRPSALEAKFDLYLQTTAAEILLDKRESIGTILQRYGGSQRDDSVVIMYKQV